MRHGAVTALLATATLCGCSTTALHERDRALWEKWHDTAIGVAAKGKSRSFRHAGAWFDPAKSLVYENRRLKALRFHFTFYTGFGDNMGELIRNKTPTDVVEYDLTSKQWKRMFSTVVRHRVLHTARS